MTGVPCILCSGTDHARECAAGQCAAQQLNLLNDPGGPTPGGFQDEEARWAEIDELPSRLAFTSGRHDRGWPHG